MKVHHLSCGSLCPRVPRALLGSPELICHCLLVETGDGLALVDTGFGLDDLARPRERLGRIFTAAVNPRLDPGLTAARQVERLGYARKDVRHIVLTHLDLDHAGGLPDFPEAEVHVFGAELDAALARATRLERHRYHPRLWAHGPRWRRYEAAGERWRGFESVRALGDTDDGILLVPLTGHSRGHCGVAVRAESGWLLHAGDAFFSQRELEPSPRCPIGLELFQGIVETDRVARLANQGRLRELANAPGDGRQGSPVGVFCAHDPVGIPSNPG